MARGSWLVLGGFPGLGIALSPGEPWMGHYPLGPLRRVLPTLHASCFLLLAAGVWTLDAMVANIRQEESRLW